MGAQVTKPEYADHPIRIEPDARPRLVLVKDCVIANTTRGVMLFEASYPGVSYVPREDVNMTLLQRSPHKTHCPFKGEASYYSIATQDGLLENAAWTYENPLPAAAGIASFLAFDPRCFD